MDEFMSRILLSNVYAELIIALKNRSPVSAVRELVEKCPEVLQKKDHPQRCPLFHALINGAASDVVQYLVDQRPNSLLEKDYRKKCPLHVALEHGASAEVIRCLVDKCPRALQEMDDDGNLPAHIAAMHDASLEVVRVLVEPYPQALRVRNRHHLYKQLPLTLILMRSHRHQREDGSSMLDVVRYLLDKCPESLGDEDDFKVRAFHHAVENDAPQEILSLLLELRPQAPREATEFGELPVHYAAKSSSPSGFASFQLLVDSWPESIQKRNRDGQNPLHIALFWNYARDSSNSVPLVERVRYTLEKWGPAIRDKASDRQEIPLHLALRKEAPHDVLGRLLDEWPESIHELTKDGEPILHFVSQGKFSFDLVRFLVERDDRIVDARRARDGSLPVHTFAGMMVRGRDRDGSALDFVRVLVERRPESVTAMDDAGCLPVHRAAKNPRQDFEVIDYLVRQRPETLAEKNRRGQNPLHLAVAADTDSLANVAFLVEQRPESLREGDNDGNLPIHIALSLKSWKIHLIEYLAEQDPDAVLERNNNGLSALHLIVASDNPPSLARNRCLDAARILVEQRPDVVAVGNHDGLLPLHLAAGRGDSCLALIELLVGERPDTAMTPALDGRLPLHCAANASAESAHRVAQCLVEHRPDAVMVATTDEGRLPLHCALAAGKEPSWLLPLVQLLVEAAPASLLVRDRWGMIPLQVAAAHPSTPLDVLWLLMKGWPESVSALRIMMMSPVAGTSPSPVASPPKRPRRE